jgi:hypothetical protein
VWVLVAVVVLAVTPLMVAGVVMLVRGWVPVGEFAQAELRVRDFWAHPPSLGAVGRLRTDTNVSSHPGPAAWWAMYPVYALFGRSAGAFSLAVTTTAAAWLAGALTLIWRRAGDQAVALAALVLLGLIGALGPAPFVEPWNPWFALMPFLCVVFAAWDMVEGHPWSLVLAVAAGSYAVQAHVGFAPVVAAVIGFGFAALLWRRFRGREPIGALPAAMGAAAGLAVVMWALPVLEQIRNDPGNLTVMWSAYRQEAERSTVVGLSRALRLVGAELDVLGPTIATDGHRPAIEDPGLGTIALVLAWALAVAVVLRNRGAAMMRSALALDAVAAVGLVAAVFATARIAGKAYGYLVMWLPVLVAVVAFVVLWTAWLALSRAPQVRRAGGWVIGAMVVAVAAVVTVQFADPPTPAAQLSEAAEDLVGQVAGQLDGEETYLIRWDDPIAFGGIGLGVISELERDGFHVGADEYLGVEVRPHRVVKPGDADAAVWVVTGEAIDRWRGVEGVREIAYTDPRSPRERAEAARLHREVVAELDTIGGEELAGRLEENYWVTREDPRVSPELAARIDELVALGLPTAVFVADPAVAEP